VSPLTVGRVHGPWAQLWWPEPPGTHNLPGHVATRGDSPPVAWLRSAVCSCTEQIQAMIDEVVVPEEETVI
jgi:hypothetical protein